MPKFPVSDAKYQNLLDRMKRVGVSEGDLEEKFIRGSGAGGQKINKTSSTVWLKHIPTGIEARCQEGRSQAMNRYFARRILVRKLEERIFHEQSEGRQKIEKIRRQKRKRSRRAKEKMLANKKHRAEKKERRKKPSPDY